MLMHSSSTQNILVSSRTLGRQDCNAIPIHKKNYRFGTSGNIIAVREVIYRCNVQWGMTDCWCSFPIFSILNCLYKCPFHLLILPYHTISYKGKAWIHIFSSTHISTSPVLFAPYFSRKWALVPVICSWSSTRYTFSVIYRNFTFLDIYYMSGNNLE